MAMPDSGNRTALGLPEKLRKDGTREHKHKAEPAVPVQADPEIIWKQVSPKTKAPAPEQERVQDQEAAEKDLMFRRVRLTSRHPMGRIWRRASRLLIGRADTLPKRSRRWATKPVRIGSTTTGTRLMKDITWHRTGNTIRWIRSKRITTDRTDPITAGMKGCGITGTHSEHSMVIVQVGERPDDSAAEAAEVIPAAEATATAEEAEAEAADQVEAAVLPTADTIGTGIHPGVFDGGH